MMARTRERNHFILVLIAFCCLPSSLSFVPLFRRGAAGFHGGASGGGGSSHDGPSAHGDSGGNGPDHDLLQSHPFWRDFLFSTEEDDEMLGVRGGAGAPQKPSLGDRILSPWRRFRKRFDKEKRREEELLQKLQTTSIRHVSLNSTLLPDAVVQIAARRCLLGQRLTTENVQEFAAALQKWYRRHGYVCHAVTGATLVPETATAEIEVREPKVADTPVAVTYCLERVYDKDTDKLMTPRQYRKRHVERRTVGFDPKGKLNTTLITSDQGATRPRRVSDALGLKPSAHFQWNAGAWQKVAGSGIFKKVWQASPRTLDDGTVQLQLVVSEASARHLEYGLAKSLYTGQWEGEVDFENINLIGGGETLGVSIRQGSKGPSGKIRFSDNRFGLGGGYDVEVFRDYIGGNDKITPEIARAKTEEADDTDPDLSDNEQPEDAPSETPTKKKTIHDSRSGASIRLHNPIDRSLMINSVATASLERVISDNGEQKGSVGTTSFGFGPFVRDLPLGARSDVDARLTLGTCVVSAESSRRYTPFSAVAATTRQTFPLFNTSSGKTRAVVLALRHTATTATNGLPRHEAIAQGATCTVRGVPNGPVYSALAGTTELRVPIQLPIVQTVQDTSFVLFTDWVFAKPGTRDPFVAKSCMGMGLRKSLQGIPLVCNLTYSKKERKIKTSLGLGRDFEV